MSQFLAIQQACMSVVCRYYQEEAVVGLFDFFTHNPVGNPIIGLPTGTGKSIVIAEFIRRAISLYPDTRVMVATHVKELVAQNHAELLEVWPTAPAGIYSAGLRRRDTHLPITFCGIGSVAKRTEEFGCVHILIVDECHMISDKAESQYVKAIEELKKLNPFLKVVGLTATPYRLGMGLLTEGKIFTHIPVNYCELDKFNKLLDDGYLSPLVPKRTQTELSVEGVGITQGEFNQDELQAAVDRESVTSAALQEAYLQARFRRAWLVFCSGVTHSEHVKDKLVSMGVSARCVHSKMTDAERDQNIRDFKAGVFQALVGCQVFTVGFNCPMVDTIICLRPTMSPILWVQMLGRGTRPSPATGKTECLVLDFAANTRRLGPINDPVVPRKKGEKGKGPAPFKVCVHCQTYNHTRARFCISCGAEFPAHVAIEEKAANDELIRKKREPQEVEVATLQEFDVLRVEYAKHLSRDRAKPPSLLVTYYCGLRIFNEWLCLEHPPGFAQHKARDAWRLMAGHAAHGDFLNPPETVDAALDLVKYLSPPSRIRVLLKSKWPEVVGYDFTGPTPRIGDPLDTVAPEDIPF